MAAESGGLMMLAEMAMKRAIHQGTEPDKPGRRKGGKAYRVIK